MIRVKYSITDLLGVMEFAGKTDVRHYLNGIHLTVGADFNNGRMAGRIEATNGHVLVASALDSEDISVTDEESRLRDVILDINALKKYVKKPRAKDRDECEFILTRDTSGANVVHYVDSNDPTILYPIELIDGRFPETVRVIRAAFSSHADLSKPIQAKYLTVIAKACALFRDRTNFHGELAPVIDGMASGHNIVQLEGRLDIVMIVMGCRVNRDELHRSLPYWLERDLMDETDHSDTGT